jgi:hypothetical protein
MPLFVGALQFPVSPGNRASITDLATDPSHRISANKLIIAWEADPDAVRESVPAPLEPDPSGLCYLIAGQSWVFTDRNLTETISESRVAFAETYFWIPCDYRGERYHFVPYSWCDRDWLTHLGRAAGMPHKLGKVEFTSFHGLDPVYYGPHEGVRLTTSVEAHGLVLRAHVDLEKMIDSSELPFQIGDDACPKWVGRRRFYDVVADRLAFDDLVVHSGDDLKLGPIWSGDASLTFFAAENEDVLSFQPRRVLGGWYLSWHFNHGKNGGYVLHDFL